MAIIIDPELEARLYEKAAEVGGDAQTLANLLIADGLRAGDLDADLTEEDKQAIRAGVQRGMADFASGRHRSAEEFYAHMSAKYGLPR
jgi:predicted transcriptional regulator